MTILVADDHPIYIEGLVNLLRSYDFEVVGRAADGTEAVRLACEKKPDIVLMDANMPVMDGIEATRLIRRAQPDIKVVILTGVEDDALLLKAIEAGAAGFLLKRLDGDSLQKNLLELQAGHNPFSAGFGDTLYRKAAENEKKEAKENGPATVFRGLNERESEMMHLLSKGMTYKEISIQINLSEQAVKYHIRKIKEQCGALTQAELLTYYNRAMKK